MKKTFLKKRAVRGMRGRSRGMEEWGKSSNKV